MIEKTGNRAVKQKNTLTIIIKVLIFACFFLPFLIIRATFYPFIFGRAVVFQILVELCFVVWVIREVTGVRNINTWKPKSLNNFLKEVPLLDYAVTGFFIVLAITTLFSLDPRRSFWSTQERMTGFFNLIHFGMFYFIINKVFGKKDFFLLLKVTLSVSVVMGLITLTVLRERRLLGGFGNPGFFALYLLFHVFFGAFLLISDNKYKKKWLSWLWRFFYVFSIVFNFILLYYTKTRGAYLGLGIGIIVFITINCITIARSSRSWFSLKRWAALGFIVAVFCFSFVFASRQASNFKRGSEGRVLSWGMSYRAFKDRPVLGWGPENYILAFSKHFDPEYAKYSKDWFDKAHNVFFEYLVTTGIFGLMAYLSMLVFAGARSPRFVMPLLIGYFITDLFWIDTTFSLMLFFLSLALSKKKVFDEPVLRSGRLSE